MIWDSAFGSSVAVVEPRPSGGLQGSLGKLRNWTVGLVLPSQHESPSLCSDLSPLWCHLPGV